MTAKGAAKTLADAPASTAAPDNGAPLLSILIHAIIIAAAIFALPYLPHRAPIELAHPIAVSVVEEKPAEEPAPVVQPTPEPQVQAQAVPDAPPAALPYDPSYNPFALNPKMEQRQSPSAPLPPTPMPFPTQGPSASDAQGQSDQASDSVGSSGSAGPAFGVPSPNVQAGSLVGDPLQHPQFIRIQLGGFVNAIYAPQLHNFLSRLIQCGVVPVPAKNSNLSVEADVDLTPMGTVRGVRLTNQGEFTEPAYSKAAQELMGALTTPSCAYLQLPPQNYPVWHTVHISFYQHIPGQ